MLHMPHAAPRHQPPFSPLWLSDCLLTLAEDADKAGYRSAAEHLLSLASEVLDAPDNTQH